MSLTTGPAAPPKTARRRRRFGVLTALSGLLAAPLVIAAPLAAHAAVCDNEPADLGDYHFVDQHDDLKVFHIRSVAETFNVSDGRIVDNRNSPVDVTGHATAQISRTFTLATTASVTTSDLQKTLSATVSTSITQAVATQIGVNIDFPVKAYGQVQADYGVRAYDIVYDLDTWEISGGHCWYKPDYRSPHNVSVNAPTYLEGWRTSVFPIVNPAGVVNATNYSAADIHPTTVLAVFGQYFAPADQVLIQQAGNRHTLQAGTAAWYDSPGQINAALPGLQPGPATLNVISSQGFLSNTVSFYVNP